MRRRILAAGWLSVACLLPAEAVGEDRLGGRVASPAAAHEAVRREPASARAHAELARVLLGLDRVDEAWSAAQQAIGLDRDDPFALTTLGFVLLARGDTDGAIDRFTRALRPGATSGEPYIGLGLAAFRRGRPGEGLQHFQAAVHLEPQTSLFHSYLAKALYQAGRREEALAALDRAQALDPLDPTPELYRGIFLRDLNRPVEAIEALQRSESLNDHHAFYRSRLGLDRDLATRNVDLALAYLALGQTARAYAAGVRALHEDPQSSSAHLFFSTVTGRPASEVLQTRLLQPVNQNTFNTFTDYTMVLEQPRVQGTLEGFGGNLDTAGGRLTVTGGTTDMAGAQVMRYGTTDGPKAFNSNDESWVTNTLVKWAPDARSTVFGHVLHAESRGGDTSVDSQHFVPNDPDLRRNRDFTLLELGYQTRPRPDSTLLLYAAGQLADRQHVRITRSGLFDLSSDVVVEQGFFDGQAAYLERVGEHQLWFAADYFSGRPETRVGFTNQATAFDVRNGNDFHRQHLTLVAHDTWRILSSLYLTGAIRYDDVRDGHIFSEQRHNSQTLSPQAGALWRVTPAHTLRFAAFRAVQPQPHAVLSPSTIAGFRINQVGPDAVTRQYHGAWDADVSPHTFFTLGGLRQETDFTTYVSRQGVVERETAKIRQSVVSATINQILPPWFGASLSYLRVHREEAGPRGDGDDDAARASLTFVHPTGIMAGLAVTYVQQDVANRRPGAPRDFGVATVSAGYEFPGKRGRLTVCYQNPTRERFDSQTLLISELPEARVLATLQLNF